MVVRPEICCVSDLKGTIAVNERQKHPHLSPSVASLNEIRDNSTFSVYLVRNMAKCEKRREENGQRVLHVAAEPRSLSARHMEPISSM